MLTQRQAYLQKAFLSSVAVLLLRTTAGQTTNNLQTKATTPLSNLTTEFNNSSVEKPMIQRVFKSCGSEHKDFCKNGGTCMYPQDSDKPSCICTSSYSGPRCFFLNPTATETGNKHPDLDKVIGITCGVLMLFTVLAVIFYFCTHKRCMKSRQLIKSSPSEMLV